jgi:hypothetical protein
MSFLRQRRFGHVAVLHYDTTRYFNILIFCANGITDGQSQIYFQSISTLILCLMFGDKLDSDEISVVKQPSVSVCL